MARNSFIIIILMTFINCNGSTNNVTKLISEQKQTFASESFIEDFLDFFPEKVNEKNALFEVSPPSCPPKYKCAAQYGDIYLNLAKDKNIGLYNNIMRRKIIYETIYSDQNIIINLYGLKDTIFKAQKCNQFFKDKYPIPHFEDHNFGLGCKTDKKVIEGETYINYTYTVPSDLQVYVIESNSGNIWKSECGEMRPPSLKNWGHGYSKGFGISEEKNMIIFWAIIW